MQYRRGMQAYVDELRGINKPWAYDPDWSKIRRGWFLGSKHFGEVLLDKLDSIRTATKQTSLSGVEIRLHNERRATQLKTEALKALGIEECDLEEMAKGAAEKKVLAWFIKSQTVVSNEWLSAQLLCGHPANVPGYVKAVRAKKDKQLRRFAKILMKK